MTKQIFLTFLLLAIFQNLNAQEFQKDAFNDRRVINSQSVEMLKKGKMDFRTYHRFGDLLGTSGGWQSFYGLENAADIGIGFDYGLNDHINFGIMRAKGAGELRQLVNGYFKARLMRQQVQGNNPLSITFVANSTISTMPKSTNANALSSFPNFSNRFAYHVQIMFARRFNQRLSLQASLNYTYRDLVYTYDQNDIPSIGLAGRIQLTKATALIFDGAFPVLVADRELPLQYQYPIGVGFEFETGGGHVFQINLTNARGLTETDYIPNTSSNWQDGEFRLGFTIGRQFTVHR